MIERMKKITIVCLVDDQERSLHSLRKLASVHVVPQKGNPSRDVEDRKRELGELQQVRFFLKSIQGDGAPVEGAAATDGAQCRLDCLRLMQEYRQSKERIMQLDQAIAQLEPWGQFDKKLLDKLERHGLHLALLVRGNRKNADAWFDELEGKPEGAQEFIVRRTKDKIYSLVVSPVQLRNLELPRASFPMGMDLNALRTQRRELAVEAERARKALERHARLDEKTLADEENRLEREIAFATTRDGMGLSGQKLCYLQGYVPEKNLDELRETAHRNGWAIRYEDVAEDDEAVPTKLQMPKHLEMAQGILDFIGILPGYREIDISVAVMVFLSIFCGMLVGDAGYGAIFCGVTGWYLRKALQCGSDSMKRGMQLLFIMSLCTLLWGILSGNWFGLAWGGLKCLTDGERGQMNVQLFCFFLAAVHLSLAHLWKLSVSSGWRDRLGNLGWALFLWANFFTVKALLIDYSFEHFTVPAWMYGIGTVLIVFFSINWRNIGDIIYSPFTFINSLGDVLSYIRLYAVGLSSLYIARAFNDMSAMMWEQSKWLLPLGLLIILAGHLLNICMALMSVLVHGVRLNTLEFSGHIGVEWGGKAYKPFR